AVQGVDFHVKKGEVVGLIGPNGAGKTTIFNLINGFYPPSTGDILFKGKSITGLKPHRICRLGIARTFQVVKPLSRLTVLENVMVSAFCRVRRVEEARKEALRVLEFTNLIHKKDELAKGLTIGDRKRLEMTRAIATGPELLLMDETVAGLNPTETEQVIEMIKKIRDAGTTIIIIEHVMRVIMSISNRIIVLHHGEKLTEGTPEEVSKNRLVIDAYLGKTNA
ncbi:MAG: ABC transporter ATP-binding protein, partial [Thermodesulfobacteriota bacterium]